MDAKPNLTAEEESQLIKRAQGGDPRAFEKLMLAHMRFAYNLALRGIGSPQEAEDLTQEAFLRAWQALPRFQGGARFSTWLYRIVVNLCYSRLPSLRREMEVLEAAEFLETMSERSAVFPESFINQPLDPPQAALERERLAYLQRQIDALPEHYRLIVLLRFMQDLSYEEVADVLDIPLGTVKTGIYRARSRLRKALQIYEESPL